MRLPIFLLLAVGVSLLVGLISGAIGAGFWLSFGRAVSALVILQVCYALFLALSVRRLSQSKLGDNGEQ
ncbi:MAG: hypothetical protein AAF222_00525 [Pseudomonadota bacterium]